MPRCSQVTYLLSRSSWARGDRRPRLRSAARPRAAAGALPAAPACRGRARRRAQPRRCCPAPVARARSGSRLGTGVPGGQGLGAPRSGRSGKGPGSRPVGAHGAEGGRGARSLESGSLRRARSAAPAGDSRKARPPGAAPPISLPGPRVGGGGGFPSGRGRRRAPSDSTRDVASLPVAPRLPRVAGGGATVVRPKRPGGSPAGGRGSCAPGHEPAGTRPGQRLRGGLGTAGVTACQRRGAAADGGEEGPGPPLRSRGRRSGSRRWDGVLSPRRKKKQMGKQGFSERLAGSLLCGRRRGRAGRPRRIRAPGPPRPYFPAGSREDVGRLPKSHGAGPAARGRQGAERAAPADGAEGTDSSRRPSPQPPARPGQPRRFQLGRPAVSAEGLGTIHARRGSGRSFAPRPLPPALSPRGAGGGRPLGPRGRHAGCSPRLYRAAPPP